MNAFTASDRLNLLVTMTRNAMEDNSDKGPKRQLLLVGVLLILVGSFTSTFAANFTLNNGNPVQFAQGIYEIDACQSYISIDLNPEYTNPGDNTAPSPGTYLSQIIVKSLDTYSCANTQIGIKFFKTGISDPLAIYESADGSPINELTLVIDDSNNVTIPLQSSGDQESIDQPILDNQTGSWTINILKRLTLMTEINSLTVESGPRPNPSSN